MSHILVADKIAEAGLERLRSTPNVTFDVRHGLSPEELASVVGGYDGMLIRSAVKVTAQTLAEPGQLTAIARAGVGVDNVDLEAATAAGVLVLNTPDANTISTAEHTFAMMLALYRKIPSAHQHVLSGEWNRGAYQGHQLAGATLGIIGLGRIGRAVAERALAFEMKVVGFDPFVKQDALDDGIELAKDIESLLACADCLTIHATVTESTKHMIGAEQLALMKEGACIVNCARGVLIDEIALAESLESGHIGGAAIDVYETEPPKDSPLLRAKNVVLAPHLAASTVEAQTRVSVDAVDSMLAYLLRGEIRSAVNISGMPTSFSPRGRAFVDLCARMGTILSPWCADGLEGVRVTVYSETLQNLASTLASQTMVSVLAPHLSDRINLVNARDLANRRGISVDHVVHSLQTNHVESVHAVVEARGQKHEILGTISVDGRPRILAIDGYRMEVVPAGPMALVFNDDQPGVIGVIGKTLGDAGINVADMALSRRGDRALMVLKLDEPMSNETRDALVALKPPIHVVRRVQLPPLAKELP